MTRRLILNGTIDSTAVVPEIKRYGQDGVILWTGRILAVDLFPPTETGLRRRRYSYSFIPETTWVRRMVDSNWDVGSVWSTVDLPLFWNYKHVLQESFNAVGSSLPWIFLTMLNLYNNVNKYYKIHWVYLLMKVPFKANTQQTEQRLCDRNLHFEIIN